MCAKYARVSRIVARASCGEKSSVNEPARARPLPMPAARSDRSMSEPAQHRVDPCERLRRPALDQVAHGLSDQPQHQRDADGGGERAEHEHRAPVSAHEQPGRNHAAEDGAERIARCHQRHREVSPAVVGAFRRHGIDRREHPADAEAGHEPEHRHWLHAARGAGEDIPAVMTIRHPEHGRAPADAVGDVAERERADAPCPGSPSTSRCRVRRGRSPIPWRCRAMRS